MTSECSVGMLTMITCYSRSLPVTAPSHGVGKGPTGLRRKEGPLSVNWVTEADWWTNQKAKHHLPVSPERQRKWGQSPRGSAASREHGLE